MLEDINYTFWTFNTKILSHGLVKQIKYGKRLYQFLLVRDKVRCQNVFLRNNNISIKII